MLGSLQVLTKRLSGFILPVSRVVDGTIVFWNEVQFCAPIPGPYATFAPWGPGLSSCSAQPAQPHIADLHTSAPAAESSLSFMSPFSLPSPHSFSAPHPQEREKDAEFYVPSACISFSPLSIFQTACVSGESFGFREMWTCRPCQRQQ